MKNYLRFTLRNILSKKPIDIFWILLTVLLITLITIGLLNLENDFLPAFLGGCLFGIVIVGLLCMAFYLAFLPFAIFIIPTFFRLIDDIFLLKRYRTKIDKCEEFLVTFVEKNLTPS